MGWSVGDRRYAIHVTWPYSWKTDLILQADAQMRPMETIQDAVREAEQWKVRGNSQESTSVTIYEEVLRLT